MKTNLLVLFMGMAGLLSCSDDKSDAPELNKIVSVTCYKNGNATPQFTMDIAYDGKGQVAYVVENDTDRKQFIYSGNTITVADFSESDMTTTEYVLSGRTIVKKKVSETNPYKKGEVYVSNEYDYGYDGSCWERTDLTVTIPRLDGTYDSRLYENDQVYEWQDGNVVRFTSDKSDMIYEYGRDYARPSNFPFRVIASFRPVGVDVFSPLNLMYGSSNQSLPVSAYCYTFPDTNNKQAEYTYAYSIIGDYVRGMVVKEKINANGSTAAETNTYTYVFGYADK